VRAAETIRSPQLTSDSYRYRFVSLGRQHRLII